MAMQALMDVYGCSRDKSQLSYDIHNHLGISPGEADFAIVIEFLFPGRNGSH